MDQDRHRRAKEIFSAALEAPAADRDRLVRELCAGDAALESEVRRVLEHLGDPETLLEQLGGAVATLGSLETTRFEPGQRIGERYTIVRLLGRGGMGEVYLADDELLGEQVALKCLTGATAAGTPWAERLLEEARAARKVIHPHVCRVHDAGTADGEPFITMEYVEGDDLATRLRQSGRIRGVEARRIALALAEALAAIHEQQLCHRDLKPANVLMDAEGRPRVSDFGLATQTDAGAKREHMIGTPGYMAPELLSGDAPTEKSDIFSLGLLLYELITGRRAFSSGASMQRALAGGEPPTAAHLLAADVDPALERIIEACLSPRPEDRPDSAKKLAAALAETDPLAAVLALGRKPSPRVMQASKARGYLGGRRAPLVAGLALALMLAIAALEPFVSSLEVAGFGEPPDQLVARARAVIERIDPTAADHDASWGYSGVGGAKKPGIPYPRGLARQGEDSFFFYRTWEFPTPNWDVTNMIGAAGRAQALEPELAVFGSSTVFLDMQGRLAYYQRGPSPLRKIAGHDGQDPWAALWEAAELDPARFERAASDVPLPSAADRRWSFFAIVDGRETTVEAGDLGGVPVLFCPLEVATEQDASPEQYRREQAAFLFLYLAAPLLFLLTLPLAWRNLRAGRGDPWGAFRLAIVMTVATYLAFVLESDWIDDAARTAILLIAALGTALLSGLGAWICYMGVEPLMQRFWPRSLVSWSHLLAGRFRDPVVLSHLLIGLLVGAAFAGLGTLGDLFTELLAGRTLPAPSALPETLPFASYTLGTMLGELFGGFFDAILLVLCVALARYAVRWAVPAAVLGIAFFSLESVLSAEFPLLEVLVFALAQVLVGYLIVTRYGLLPLAVANMVDGILEALPYTLDSSRWYAPMTALGLTVLVLSAIFVLLLLRESSRPSP